MVKKIALSIIVPVYNVENYLTRCIESLYNQGIDDNNFEVILVNDGSTDNSLKIADDNKKKHPDLEIISQKNQGLSAARNTGLRYASGEYVIFVDSDDWLLPNTMSKVLKIALENKLDICGYRLKVMQPDGKMNIGLVQPFAPEQILTGEEMVFNGGIISSVCANMYSRQFIISKDLKFTVGMSHEDVDFNASAYGYAKRIMFTDVVGYVYYYNSTSMNRSQNPSKVRKYYFDDILVAKNMKLFSESDFLSSRFKKFYVHHANSIIVSEILTFIRDKNLRYLLNEYLELAHKEGLFPIVGRTLSWKTTLLLPLINRRFLYRFIRKD